MCAARLVRVRQGVSFDFGHEGNHSGEPVFAKLSACFTVCSEWPKVIQPAVTPRVSFL